MHRKKSLPWLRRSAWLKECKHSWQKDRTGKDSSAGPKPSLFRSVGPELNSPSNMFLGLPLRSKSVLRNSGRICLANRSQGNVTGLPHPPPKGHACLISMRQHAAFGPPPWWGGSTLRVELRGKTRRQAVVRIRNALLNFIIAIIPQIEF